MQGARVSNSRIKPKGDIAAQAVAGGARGLAYIRAGAGGEIDAAKAIREGLNATQVAELLKTCEAEEGDLLLVAAGPEDTVNKCAPMPPLSLLSDKSCVLGP